MQPSDFSLNLALREDSQHWLDAGFLPRREHLWLQRTVAFSGGPRGGERFRSRLICIHCGFGVVNEGKSRSQASRVICDRHVPCFRPRNDALLLGMADVLAHGDRNRDLLMHWLLEFCPNNERPLDVVVQAINACRDGFALGMLCVELQPNPRARTEYRREVREVVDSLGWYVLVSLLTRGTEMRLRGSPGGVANEIRRNAEINFDRIRQLTEVHRAA